MDLKVLNSALQQLEEERGIPREKIVEAIEQALAAAYKKDYGKKGQIVRAYFDLNTGTTEFSQIKIVVDKDKVRMDHLDEQEGDSQPEQKESSTDEETEEDELIRFNPEHHILLEDAQKIKKDAKEDDELVFPLEMQDDYGRIAAQTAKQVIIQRIREAEKISVMDEYGKKEGEIVLGSVQRIERGTIFIDLGKTVGIIPYEEQIPGERYRQGERISSYLYSVEEGPRGIQLKLSRSHPKFIEKLFSIEAPEISNGVVEIKEIAREAGSRSKIAVYSNDEHIDPVGSCVGQRGVRVSTVMSELGGEKIDIIEWSEDPEKFIEDALSPANVTSVEINEDEHSAIAEVIEDQLSLAIGKGGQNVRLAARLTGWRIDIKGVEGETAAESDDETVEESQPKTDKSVAIEESEEKIEDTAETKEEDAEKNPETTEKSESKSKEEKKSE